MNDKSLKYFFCLLLASLLIIIVLTSRDAGISCDEILHYNHSIAVYNYYESAGHDQAALNTPVSHLKYYGQSFDNLVTIIIKWFNIEDVYGFRHVMSSLAGWLTVLVTAFFAVWLSGYRTGIFVIILFSVTPAFVGHSYNNLKDIPFALAYISGIFFTLRFIRSGRKVSLSDAAFLTASIAFAISIRAGGLLLLCYLFLYLCFFWFIRYVSNGKIEIRWFLSKLAWVTGITIIAWILGIVLWPFALQAPIGNVLESYKVMAHFPDTFRQIFEGKSEWSDFMPWYYLPKSMMITIPVIVLAGLITFIISGKYIFTRTRAVRYGSLLFTLIFPVLFVIYEKSNLYSSWRQFLFLFPVIVIISATGFNFIFEKISSKYLRVTALISFAILSVHPVKFMIRNHPYEYMYYNQLSGGLKGAYADYETDYYFVSQTEASGWLIDHLEKNNIQGNIKVKATYSVNWLFRKYPAIQTSWFRYEERSQSDWDYAIVVNRYISPFQLNNHIWPPENAIHVINVDNVPVCAILKRESTDDYNGYKALTEERYDDAIDYFEKALQVDNKDELIFYNFAAALYNAGHFERADSVLKKGLEVNPDYEPILMYLGNISRNQGKTSEAIFYYEKVIKANRKYFEAYVELSKLLLNTDLMKARSLLRTCLTIYPEFKPAIVALADTYRTSDPEIAKKYDELANTIN